MTHLIRHSRSGLFFTETGQWTEQVAEAWHFPNPLLALHVKKALKLPDLELYCSFNRQFAFRADFTVPFPDEPAGPEPTKSPPAGPAD